MGEYFRSRTSRYLHTCENAGHARCHLHAGHSNWNSLYSELLSLLADSHYRITDLMSAFRSFAGAKLFNQPSRILLSCDRALTNDGQREREREREREISPGVWAFISIFLNFPLTSQSTFASSSFLSIIKRALVEILGTGAFDFCFLVLFLCINESYS